ncbi:hypothetical protein GOP47_0028422 [Adiantum capillus-veneris]|nr:hypothetical protein GOP47_0028422 [Adiantum capillus-veneris]
MLVYDIQITKEKESRLTQLKQGMPVEDVKKEEKSIHRELIHKYQERIGKLLNILDPNLGTDWLAKIMSLKWGHDSWETLEKLNLIALHDAPMQNKIQWVSLLESDRITRTAFGLKKGDNLFRHWLHREGYLARLNYWLTGFCHVWFQRESCQLSHLWDAAAEARQPPPATSEARQPGVHLSSERMETVVDTTIVKDVLEHDSSGLIVVRRSIQFVYVLESPLRYPMLPVDTRCIAIVGDYISIAANYREDFVFLDLPFGGLHIGSSSPSRWDIFTEEHVRSAIHLTFSTLADFGWLLIMASTMVVHRRIIVLHHSSYGYVESLSGRIQCQCSMLLMRSREEASTSLDVEDEGDMPSWVDPYDD